MSENLGVTPVTSSRGPQWYPVGCAEGLLTFPGIGSR